MVLEKVLKMKGYVLLILLFTSCGIRNFERIGGITINLRFNPQNIDASSIKTALLSRAKTMSRNARVSVVGEKIAIQLPGYFDTSKISPLLWSNGKFSILEARNASYYIRQFMMHNDSMKLRCKTASKDEAIYDTLFPFIDLIIFNLDINDKPLNMGVLGYVKTIDTLIFKDYLKTYTTLISENNVVSFGQEIAINNINYTPLYVLDIGKNLFNNNMVERFYLSKSAHSYPQFSVLIEFKHEFHSVWEEFTRRNTKEFVAVLVNNQVYMCPMVQNTIPNGKLMIPMNYEEEANLLIAVLTYNLPNTNLNLLNLTVTSKKHQIILINQVTSSHSKILPLQILCIAPYPLVCLQKLSFRLCRHLLGLNL
jgi:hypothetical protein